MPEGQGELKMKADLSDAPEHIKPSSRRSRANAWIIPSVIGTCVSLGLLQVAASAFLGGTVHKLADKDAATRSTPVVEITRPENPANIDWDSIVDEQAKSGLQAQTNTFPDQAKVQSAPTKKNVFNDNNYTPRGADNVVSFNEPTPINEEKKSPGKIRVTIVKQEPSMKDRACWPLKEGSIERRSCRSQVGLNYRN